MLETPPPASTTGPAPQIGQLVIDESGTVLFADQGAARLFGTTREALVGTALGRPFVKGETTVVEVMTAGGAVRAANLRLRALRTNGRRSWHAVLRPLSADSEMIFDDEASRLHDGLTGFLNRQSFEEHIRRALSRLERRGHPLAVIRIDVASDRRHLTGDSNDLRVLGIAHRLVARVRSCDIIARCDDRWLGILAEVSDENGARRVASRLQETLCRSAPTQVRGSAAVSLVLTDDPLIDPSSLTAAPRGWARATTEFGEVPVTVRWAGRSRGGDTSGDRPPVDVGPPATGHRDRSLIESMVDGVVIVDGTGTVVFANSAATQVLGRPLEDLLGGEFGVPVDTGRASELEIIRPDGASAVAELRVVTAEWNGEPVQMAMLHETTERHRAELELIRLNAELSRAVEDVEMMSSYVAHDLKQELSAAQMALHALRRRRDSGDEQAAALFESVDRCHTEIGRSIRAILDFARASGSRAVAAPFECGEVFERSRSIVAGMDGSVTSDPLPRVVADELLFQQVLQNLIANALTHGGRGTDGRVHVSARTVPEGWLFSVADNGRGIDPSLRDRLFEPYWRLGERAGDGLGLAACKRAVERLGGRIWVEDGPDGGSCFCFVLPQPPLGARPAS